jgi:hypothetical protein
VAQNHPGAAFGPRQLIIASITGARTAGRAPTHCTADGAEAGPDCGATPSVARNCPDKGAPGRASGRALKRPRRNGLARRRWTRRVAVTRRRVILRIPRISDRRCSCGDADAGHRSSSQEKSSKSQHSGHPQLSRHQRLSGEVAIIRQPSRVYNRSAPPVFEFERHEASDRDGEVELSEHRF